MANSKVEIVANFHVFVPDVPGRDRKVEFRKGMVVEEADMPPGQSAQDWIDKGLAKAAKAAGAGSSPAQEAGDAV